jgi:hypothetical protein
MVGERAHFREGAARGLQALMLSFNWGQLSLRLDEEAPKNAEELQSRLRALGLGTMHRVKLTRNRTVVVSHGRGQLRIITVF